jgi:uncharacterized protein (TIGR02118 family)
MLKFMVVLYKRPDLSEADFRRHREQVHGPLARNLPGLRRYIQNHRRTDVNRKHPGWDAIVELYFDDWDALEAAWASREGAASDADLPAFVDMRRSTWSVVEEVTVLP